MTDQPLVFATVDEFAQWMEEHHRTASEVWVALAKKGTDVPSVTRTESLDVALCYGWIDGKASSVGTPDGWWAQRFTPRRPRSSWSKVNCTKVEELIRTGRMRPAGLEQIELAKADGRWDAAYDPPSTAQMPEDLQKALAANPAAESAYAALSKSSSYLILLSLQKAKKPETKARRIAEYVSRLAAGEPPHPPRRTKEK
ncbi:YdeI family protein [Streptomyces sp. NPDC085927]|uniref:YdeI family protein n=1 Tax=Streptomyces sp. NPDC085927 TaxID=3365738 RepID=UPI0037D4D29F